MLHVLNLLYRSRSAINLVKPHYHAQKLLSNRSLNSPVIRNARDYSFYFTPLQAIRPKANIRDVKFYTTLDYNTESYLEDDRKDEIQLAKKKFYFFDNYTKKRPKFNLDRDFEFYLIELPQIITTRTKNKKMVKVMVDQNISQHIPSILMQIIDKGQISQNPLQAKVCNSLDFDAEKTFYANEYIPNEPVISSVNPNILCNSYVMTTLAIFKSLFNDETKQYLANLFEAVEKDIIIWCQLNGKTYDQVEPEMVLGYVNMHFAAHLRCYLRQQGLILNIAQDVESVRVSLHKNGVLRIEFYETAYYQ